MKSVFIAGQIEDRNAVTEIKETLIQMNYIVIHDWIEWGNNHLWNMTNEDAQKCSLIDIDAINKCDLFVIMTSNLIQGTGMYVELGYAICLFDLFRRPQICLVGDCNFRSIYYSHINIKQYSNINEFIKYAKIFNE